MFENQNYLTLRYTFIRRFQTSTHRNRLLFATKYDLYIHAMVGIMYKVVLRVVSKSNFNFSSTRQVSK